MHLCLKTSSGKVFVNLVCTKTRVSPVKVVLATKLMESVCNSLNIKINNKFYFSDSTIAVHYIKSNANILQIELGKYRGLLVTHKTGTTHLPSLMPIQKNSLIPIYIGTDPNFKNPIYYCGQL